MTYEITCTFTVSKLHDSAEALDFGMSLTEHVLDTFNDNETISTLVQVRTKPVKRRV